MYHKHYESELFTLVIFQLGTNPLRRNTHYQNNNEKFKLNKYTNHYKFQVLNTKIMVMNQ